MGSYKVAPAASADSLFPGMDGKPFPHTKFTHYDPEYLKRKAELKEEFCTLRDGRKICYYRDGDASGVPIIAMHGGCEGKWKFITRNSIPGVCIYSIDRPNYGKSSPIDLNYTFAEAADDVCQLADHLGLDKFCLMGHSVGTSWSQQIAAAKPDRVRGIILFASMADPFHPEADDKLRKAVQTPPGALHPKTGCCGCIVRGFLKKTVDTRWTADSGLGLEKGQDMFKKFCEDQFWVSSLLDSWNSHTVYEAILGDTYRSLAGKWLYETRDIKCPVFIYAGEKDHDCQYPVSTDFLKKLIPQAVVEVVPDCGHCTVNGPNQWTNDRILKAVKAMP